MSKQSKHYSSFAKFGQTAYRCKITQLPGNSFFYITATGANPCQFMAKIKPLYPEPYFRIDDLHILSADVVLCGGYEFPLTDKDLYGYEK